MKLLTNALCEAKGELEGYVEGGSADRSRRLDAIRVALYSLGKLENHIRQSSRILNDLRTLRRLLVAERGIQTKTTLSSRRSVADENASSEAIEAQLTVNQRPV